MVSNACIVNDAVCHVQESNQEIVTREDCLLIRLSALCCDANVLLYLAMILLRYSMRKQNMVWFLTHPLFLSINKHMCDRFPIPKAKSLQIG